MGKHEAEKPEDIGPLCEFCATKPANFSLDRSAGGRVWQDHICVDCAAKLGLRGGDTVLPMTVGDLYAGVLDPEGTSTRDLKSCDNCGTSFQEVRLSGRVGCEHCFTVFHTEIEGLLPRLSTSTHHSGSVPSRLRAYKRLFVDKAELKERLDAALRAEDYESAAQLRDAINEIDEIGAGDE